MGLPRGGDLRPRDREVRSRPDIIIFALFVARANHALPH
jgi:hypothetical protein